MEAQKCIDAMDFMKDWSTWRKSLHEGISAAKKFGMSDQEIEKVSTQVGDFLAEKVCPASKEEELLKEMWDVGSPDERKVLSSLIFKMVK